MTNKQLRDNLKTLSKIEQQLHMYNPDQLRNVLKIAITCAREATKEQMQSIEGNRITRPENEAQGGGDRAENYSFMDGKHNCFNSSRVINCDGETDVRECRKCGRVWETACNFDEDFS